MRRLPAHITSQASPCTGGSAAAAVQTASNIERSIMHICGHVSRSGEGGVGRTAVLHHSVDATIVTTFFFWS